METADLLVVRRIARSNKQRSALMIKIWYMKKSLSLFFSIPQIKILPFLGYLENIYIKN